MTTEFIVSAFPAARMELRADVAAHRAPRVGLTDVLAAIGEGLHAAKTYESLVDQGFAPDRAARKALELVTSN